MPLLANINVGSAPNDGTGDSIRDSFIIVNENFQYIEQFFPNTLAANLNANITSNGTSSFNTVNISGVTTSTGNISTSAYFLGNGSQLTSITGSNVSGQVGNALVAGTVYTNAQPNITSVGTLTGLSVTGNISSTNTIFGNIGTTSQTNITSVGTLTSLSVSGNATIDGNLTTANIALTGAASRSRITGNAIVIDKVGIILHEATILTANISFANIDFSNTFIGSYALRQANANVTVNYSNVTSGRLFTLHLKNVNGSTIYAVMPNNVNNKATNLIPITANTVASFNFMCYDTTSANVAVTIVNS